MGNEEIKKIEKETFIIHSNDDDDDYDNFHYIPFIYSLISFHRKS